MLRHTTLRFLAISAFAFAISSCGGGEPNLYDQGKTHQQTASTPVRVGTIPKQAPPQVVGESAIVIDAESGRVLYAKNADSIRPVASTQKLVTALTVISAGNVNKQVTIQSSDTRCEPTKLYLRPGETYSRTDLMRALIVKSGNDVARALARDVGGSQEGFAVMMNRKAASLGMRHSNFVNPNGLPAQGQYSTARDIAIAARAAYQVPLIRSWTRIKSYTFRYSDGRTKFLENTNRLLKSVPYCDGMKTGTTNAAGRCLVSSGTLNGRSAIVVVLKSNSAHIWKDSEKLLRWALERDAAE
ncbi:D-alanyl-D-alanine carboxypeptidase family protein [Haloferula chungangensis]|uniref:D-alanyl-D-alanine carboxypeptidase family protein n=1 Tax=Haloferula chungangensis TaxID=1048331 RepID=A0ABW2L3G2_9BACT